MKQREIQRETYTQWQPQIPLFSYHLLPTKLSFRSKSSVGASACPNISASVYNSVVGALKSQSK